MKYTHFYKNNIINSKKTRKSIKLKYVPHMQQFPPQQQQQQQNSNALNQFFQGLPQAGCPQQQQQQYLVNSQPQATTIGLQQQQQNLVAASPVHVFTQTPPSVSQNGAFGGTPPQPLNAQTFQQATPPSLLHQNQITQLGKAIQGPVQVIPPMHQGPQLVVPQGTPIHPSTTPGTYLQPVQQSITQFSNVQATVPQGTLGVSNVMLQPSQNAPTATVSLPGVTHTNACQNDLFKSVQELGTINSAQWSQMNTLIGCPRQVTLLTGINNVPNLQPTVPQILQPYATQNNCQQVPPPLVPSGIPPGGLPGLFAQQSLVQQPPQLSNPPTGQGLLTTQATPPASQQIVVQQSSPPTGQGLLTAQATLPGLQQSSVQQPPQLSNLPAGQGLLTAQTTPPVSQQIIVQQPPQLSNLPTGQGPLTTQNNCQQVPPLLVSSGIPPGGLPGLFTAQTTPPASQQIVVQQSSPPTGQGLLTAQATLPGLQQSSVQQPPQLSNLPAGQGLLTAQTTPPVSQQIIVQQPPQLSNLPTGQGPLTTQNNCQQVPPPLVPFGIPPGGLPGLLTAQTTLPGLQQSSVQQPLQPPSPPTSQGLFTAQTALPGLQQSSVQQPPQLSNLPMGQGPLTTQNNCQQAPPPLVPFGIPPGGLPGLFTAQATLPASQQSSAQLPQLSSFFSASSLPPQAQNMQAFPKKQQQQQQQIYAANGQGCPTLQQVQMHSKLTACERVRIVNIGEIQYQADFEKPLCENSVYSCDQINDPFHTSDFTHVCKRGKSCPHINDPEHTKSWLHFTHLEDCKTPNCPHMKDPEHRMKFHHKGYCDFLIPCKIAFCPDKENYEHCKVFQHENPPKLYSVKEPKT